MAPEEVTQSSTRKRSRSDTEDGLSQASNGAIAGTVGEEGKSAPNDMRILSLRSCLLDTSSDDGIGPALPSSVPRKKRRALPYEKLYISALPTSPRYSKSLMHKDQLSFVTITPYTDFLITSSTDGVVKFWKKVAVGIEFVKEFRAHIGEIKSVGVSADGRSFATAGADKSVKIFDIITFGM